MNKAETFFSALLNKIKGKHKLSEKEQLIVNIVNELFSHKDTDIKAAPLTGRYFIVNKTLEYWVRISEFEITITNHKFTFNYSGIPAFHNMLAEVVLNHLENARDEFEKAVFENEIDLLENIFINIKHKK